VRPVTAGSLTADVMVNPGAEEPAAAAPARAELDPASRAWVASLRVGAPDRDAAITRLHDLLLRGARFEAGRRRDSLRFLRPGELDDIAEEAADDALLAVLNHLDDFRGLSRFTTWAYKFALLEAAVKMRKRSWQDREVPVEAGAWDLVPGAGDPARTAEANELLQAVRRTMETALTPHQRRVLVALALQGVPIDVLADRLSTTRGALYKTLHDARRRLRRELTAAGYDLELGQEGP
jgi:RNA polymerase sigma-70 factor (ECF subfamily)